MIISRRLLLASSMVAAATRQLPAVAQSIATPESSPEPLTPDAIFEALRDAPFESPLLAADSGEIIVSEWIDTGDSDLEGAVGGLLFGGAESGTETSIGAMIVHHTAQTAADRVERGTFDTNESQTVRDISIAGLSGTTLVAPSSGPEDVDQGYAVTAVATGVVIISGGAEGIPNGELETRSLANTIALIDHYYRVTGYTTT